MMEIVTAELMRQIDKFSIENLGIPSIVLMENAALKVLKNIQLNNHEHMTIVCGNGNNGGDGLALARHLILLDKKVAVFILGEDKSLSKDCQINYDILLNMKAHIEFISCAEQLDILKKSISDSSLIVDAIFGTGLSREVRDIYKDTILLINSSNSYKISIDIPSGLNSDTGEILGYCVKADKTISFQYYKRGFLKYGVEEYTGHIIIEKIGIPDLVKDRFNLTEAIVEKKWIKEAIPRRRKHQHKGDFGRVSIIAGSQGFTGAAYITTEAAVKSGAGLVTLCCNENIQEIMSNKLVEAMTLNYKDKEKLNEVLGKNNVIAVGPGMGDSSGTLKIVTDIIKYTKCPIVIDADGINVLKNNLQLLKEKNSDIVLTPHMGEMARITGMSIETIEKNKIHIAKAFAKEYNVILLLKGYNTIVSDGEKVIINNTGNSAMASGGMGDCLTGLIASLIGQGLSAFKAAYVGAYIHGYCGDNLAKESYSVSASNILEQLPKAIKELSQ